jgi:hypothetical protein
VLPRSQSQLYRTGFLYVPTLATSGSDIAALELAGRCRCERSVLLAADFNFSQVEQLGLVENITEGTLASGRQCYAIKRSAQ